MNMTDEKYHYHDFSESAKLRAFIRNTATDKEIALIPLGGSGFVAISRPDPCNNKPVVDAIQHLERAINEQSEDIAIRQAVNLGTAMEQFRRTILMAAGVVSLMLAGVIVVLLI